MALWKLSCTLSGRRFICKEQSKCHVIYVPPRWYCKRVRKLPQVRAPLQWKWKCEWKWVWEWEKSFTPRFFHLFMATWMAPPVSFCRMLIHQRLKAFRGIFECTLSLGIYLIKESKKSSHALACKIPK